MAMRGKFLIISFEIRSRPGADFSVAMADLSSLNVMGESRCLLNGVVGISESVGVRSVQSLFIVSLTFGFSGSRPSLFWGDRRNPFNPLMVFQILLVGVCTPR